MIYILNVLRVAEGIRKPSQYRYLLLIAHTLSSSVFIGSA